MYCVNSYTLETNTHYELTSIKSKRDAREKKNHTTHLCCSHSGLATILSRSQCSSDL